MAKFQLGRLCATRGVADTMNEQPGFAQFVHQSLARYIAGDWGNLTQPDKAMNDEAVRRGDERILAAYEHTGQPARRIWIITEADRSATTVLFPDEY